MCVKSLLCGPRAGLWPFYGFLCKRFSLYKGKPFLMLRNNADPRRCSYFEPGLPVQKHGQNHARITAYRIYKRYYLTIIPRGRVGYEMIDCQRGA